MSMSMPSDGNSMDASASLKHFESEIALLSPQDLNNVGKAIESYRTHFGSAKSAESDQGFAKLYRLTQLAAGFVDRSNKRQYPQLVQSLSTGQEADLNTDDFTKSLYNNGLTMKLDANQKLTIVPNYGYLASTYSANISNDTKLFLKYIDAEYHQPATPITSSTALESLVQWEALISNTEFPLLKEAKQVYRKYLTKAFPTIHRGDEIPDEEYNDMVSAFAQFKDEGARELGAKFARYKGGKLQITTAPYTHRYDDSLMIYREDLQEALQKLVL